MRRPAGLFRSQRPFAEKIVELAELINEKPTQAALLLSHASRENYVINFKRRGKDTGHPFRDVRGPLYFLASRTRPDIATSVFVVAKYQQSSMVEHWRSMKSVIRYLIGSLSFSISLPDGQEALLVVVQCGLGAGSPQAEVALWISHHCRR